MAARPLIYREALIKTAEVGSDGRGGDVRQRGAHSAAMDASSRATRPTAGQLALAERFIRTLKENLLWVRTFDTIEELRPNSAVLIRASL